MGVVLLIIIIVAVCKIVSECAKEDRRTDEINKMILGKDGKGVLGIIDEMNKDK